MDDETRSRFGTLEGWIEALRMAEGFYPGAEGFRIGPIRVFVQAVSGDYHVHQREEDGTESDLTGAKSIWGVPIHSTAPTAGYVLVYNDSTGEVEWTASSTPGAHVLATTAGLGPAHTTSGLTARQVLRATGATTAAFGAIQDADLPSTIARDSELHAQAHGPAQHTTGNAWKMVYQDAAGDEAEIAVGADGTVLTGQGTSAAPAFQAASEHAHANDHAQAHGPSDHTSFDTWKVIYTDASGDQQEVAVGADGTVFTGTGTSSAPAFEAASGHTHTSTYLATDTLWAAAGDLAKGTGDDTADILSVGSAGDFLRVGGGAPYWDATGIADNNPIIVDATDGAPNDDEYARWTAIGLEGRTYAQLKSDIGFDAAAVSAVATADDYLKNDASDTTSGTVTAAGFTTTGIATLQAVAIDSTPANDTCSGITAELTAGAALTRGDCCYVGSDGKMEKADADAEATSRCIAIVEEATIAENAVGTFLLHGFFEKEFNFGANIGKRVYLDTATAGGVTLTQPSGEDDCIVIVGIVMGDDLLYFNPSVQAIVEHVAP